MQNKHGILTRWGCTADISEEGYRQEPAMHYTTIARFIREGYNSLFNDVKYTQSISFGSLVDTLVTQPKMFPLLYKVTPENLTITPKELEILKYCYDSSEQVADYKELDYITILSAYELWPKNYKASTRKEKTEQLLKEKYNYYVSTQGKTLISSELYAQAQKCAYAAKEKLETLVPQNHDIEYYYQTKFITNIDDIKYKCMFDIIMIDHTDEIIYPIDLKTTSHIEKDFASSYAYFNYYIQAELYMDILKKKLKMCQPLRAYRLHNFLFLVINKDLKHPIFWEHTYNAAFPDYRKYGKKIYDIIQEQRNLPQPLTEQQLTNTLKIYETSN